MHCPTAPDATAIATEGDTITWIGEAGLAPKADRTVDFGDALITPAFVDSHAHIGGTGATLLGFRPGEARSGADLLDRLASHAGELPTDAIVLAHGWDETTWPEPVLPTPDELERAGGGRRVYLSRTCGHTGIASAGFLADHPELAAYDGYDASGTLSRDAHRQARARAMAVVPASQRLQTSEAALRHAASLGIAALVENFIPIDSDPAAEEEFRGLLDLGSKPHLPDVYGWWGEPQAAERARDLGAYGCGGDLSVDGSIGARTAALNEDYSDDPGNRGVLYYSAEEIRDHLLNCHHYAMPAAFHAIGDAAIDTVVEGFSLAAETLPLTEIRSARHRIEHVEMLSTESAAAMVHFGLHASVQPAFDAAWGGEEAMYATRIGEKRSLEANPWSQMHGIGIPLALGSDSPVTALDPWGGVKAAANHHNPAHSLNPEAAFSAATKGGWRALGVPDAGKLTPGMKAYFAAWDLKDATPEQWSDALAPAPECLATVAAGETLTTERLTSENTTMLYVTQLFGGQESRPALNWLSLLPYGGRRPRCRTPDQTPGDNERRGRLDLLCFHANWTRRRRRPHRRQRPGPASVVRRSGRAVAEGDRPRKDGAPRQQCDAGHPDGSALVRRSRPEAAAHQHWDWEKPVCKGT